MIHLYRSCVDFCYKTFRGQQDKHLEPLDRFPALHGYFDFGNSEGLINAVGSRVVVGQFFAPVVKRFLAIGISTVNQEEMSIPFPDGINACYRFRCRL